MRQLAGLLLFGWRYRLKVSGIDNIPKDGPVLLLGNHISYIDFALIQWATPRTIRFVVHDDYYSKPTFNWILRGVGAVSIRPENSRNAMQNIINLLNDDCVVCLFPEGHVSTSGELSDLKRGFEKVLSQSKEAVIVVPFAIKNMWGSFFSKAPRAVKKRMKFRLRREVKVKIGTGLNSNTTKEEVKKQIGSLLN
ncbi:1-acyl-sn-glycerol-3-phosphate acyltransferase [Candidatus Pseudothioglobus singularis]|nr:1-acyl-sn-glycerol-3-phosphate acyltransferase [Candidatus Pseudothioglobus singularis]MDC3280888.1 1-acyl-sn-glycerol-3-phosphate acyltransferase [Candidatus Pseudothioglobus singularis]